MLSKERGKKTLYLRSVLEEMQKEEEGTKWKQEEKWPEERPSSWFCVSRDHPYIFLRGDGTFFFLHLLRLLLCIRFNFHPFFSFFFLLITLVCLHDRQNDLLLLKFLYFPKCPYALFHSLNHDILGGGGAFRRNIEKLGRRYISKE